MQTLLTVLHLPVMEGRTAYGLMGSRLRFIVTGRRVHQDSIHQVAGDVSKRHGLICRWP